MLRNPQFEFAMMGYCILLALLVVATFIDYDLMIIPDEVTITGMVLGVGFERPVPLDPARAFQRDDPSRWTRM